LGDIADCIRVHPDDLKQVQEMFQQCRTKTVATEFRFLSTDDEIAAGLTEKWVEASGGPVFDDNGVIVMLSGGLNQPHQRMTSNFHPGALLDITQRRQHLMSQTQKADEALELKRLQDHFIDMLASDMSLLAINIPDFGSPTNSEIRSALSASAATAS
jgi:hypothetical protein